MTRKQKRAENKRRHRLYRRMKVTTYDDLIARDRNPRRHRNPRSFLDEVFDEQRKPKRYTILSDGHHFELFSRKVTAREIKPGWFVLASGVSEEQVNAIIPRYAAKMEALHNPRRRNPIVRFKARGRRVRFYAKPKRRGPVPKQLRRHVFKKRGRR